MFECIGFLNGLTEPVSIFNVAAKVTYPGVEDVSQGIFPQEQIAK